MNTNNELTKLKKRKKILSDDVLKRRKEFDFDFSETEDESIDEIEDVVEENSINDEDHYFSDKMFIRLKMALDRVKANYSDLRNELRKYSNDKMVFRSNNSGDVYLVKGKVVLKVVVFSRSIKVYFALSMKDFNKKEIEKYHIIDVSEVKKYEQIPCMLRISSDRTYRYFLEILDKLVKKLHLSKNENKIPEIDYERDVLSNSQEILHLLGYDDVLTKACTKESSAVLPNNIAKNCQILQTNPEKVKGKKIYAEITIGELSAAIKSKYEINLELLQEIGLVNAEANALRIIANGDCKAKLSCVADDYEIEALKMIIITGGNAIKYI